MMSVDMGGPVKQSSLCYRYRCLSNCGIWYYSCCYGWCMVFHHTVPLYNILPHSRLPEAERKSVLQITSRAFFITEGAIHLPQLIPSCALPLLHHQSSRSWYYPCSLECTLRNLTVAFFVVPTIGNPLHLASIAIGSVVFCIYLSYCKTKLQKIISQSFI